jgi:hypothetical protein
MIPKNKEQRFVRLPNGTGLLLHRLTNSVMACIGPVGQYGEIGKMTHYRYYTVDGGKLTRKVRRS